MRSVKNDGKYEPNYSRIKNIYYIFGESRFTINDEIAF